MARLIILDIPSGVTFGIDAFSFTIGIKFRGVRLIPPGLHYCHYSVGGGDEQQSNGFGGRHGFFFAAREADDIIVWRWNNSLEDLEPGHRALSEGSLAALEVAWAILITFLKYSRTI